MLGATGLAKLAVAAKGVGAPGMVAVGATVKALQLHMRLHT